MKLLILSTEQYLGNTGLPAHAGPVLGKCALGVPQVQRLPRLHRRVRPPGPGEKTNHDHLPFQLLSKGVRPFVGVHI